MANELLIRVSANAKQAVQSFLGLRNDVKQSMSDVKRASSDTAASLQKDAAKAAQSLQTVQQEAKETDQAFDLITPGDALARLTAAIREMVQAFLGLSQEVKRVAVSINAAMSEVASNVQQEAQKMENALNDVQQEAQETENTFQNIDLGNLGLEIAGRRFTEVAANASQAAQAFLGLRKDVEQSMTGVKQATDEAAASIRQDADKVKASLEEIQREAKETDQAFESIEPGDSGLARILSSIKQAVQSFLGFRKDVEQSMAGAKQASNDAAQSIKQDAEKMEQALQGVQEEAKETQQAFERIDPQSLGLAAIGATASGAIESAAVSLGKLQAQMGLTREEAEAFSDVARRVYREKFGQSLGEVHEILVRVAQTLGYTADEAEEAAEVTKDIIRIRDAFEPMGADIQMITESLRAMTAAWPGLDEQQVLDLIALGFQRGAGNAGDLQDTLQEYPRYFRDIGLSAQDMMQWLITGMQHGARNTDLLADAVKEFGIRVKTAGDTGQEAIMKLFPEAEAKRLIQAFAQGGEAGRQAFFRVLEALAQVRNEQEKYNLAVMLFGTQGEDLASVLTEDMVQSFLAAKDATLQAKGATESLDVQYTGLQAKLEQFKRIFETSVIGAFGGLGPAIGEATQVLANIGITLLGLKGIGLDVGNIFSGLGGKFQSLGNILTSNVFPLFSRLGTLLLSLVTGPAAPFILVGTAAAALGVVIYQNWDKIEGWTKEKWGNVKDFISSSWENIKSSAETKLESIKNSISSKWDNIKSATSAKWDQIKSSLASTWDSVSSLASSKFESLKSAIATKWENVKTSTSTSWGQVKNFLSSTWDSVKSLAATKFDNIKSTIAVKWDNIKSSTSASWEQIKNNLSSAWAGIKSSAVSIFESMRSSIVSKWESLKSSARSIFERVKEYILAPFRNIRIPLPHFDLKVTYKTIGGVKVPIPDVDVRWYQTGGVFTKPVVPGFGDVEEAIVPFEGPHARRIAGLIAGEMTGMLARAIGEALSRTIREDQSVNRPIVLNIDGRTVAQILAPHMDQLLARRQRTSLRAGGIT